MSENCDLHGWAHAYKPCPRCAPTPAGPAEVPLVMTTPTRERLNQIADEVVAAIDPKRGGTGTVRAALVEAWLMGHQRASAAPPGSGLRPEVRAFAEAMERELRENEHKGGWEDIDTEWLLKRMTEERRELTVAVDRYWRAKGDREVAASLAVAARRVLSEAADVANFAMMIADVCGGLTHDK